jgi:hypothetical protein
VTLPKVQEPKPRTIQGTPTRRPRAAASTRSFVDPFIAPGVQKKDLTQAGRQGVAMARLRPHPTARAYPLQLARFRQVARPPSITLTSSPPAQHYFVEGGAIVVLGQIGRSRVAKKAQKAKKASKRAKQKERVPVSTTPSGRNAPISTGSTSTGSSPRSSRRKENR